MFYLIDFKYQEPDKRYWGEILKKAKKNSLRKVNMRESLEAPPSWQIARELKRLEENKEKESYIDRRLRSKDPKEREELTRKIEDINKRKIYPKIDKREKILKEKKIQEFRKKVLNNLFDENRMLRKEPLVREEQLKTPEVKEVISKTPTQKGTIGLGKKALIGTAGIAGLGAVAYGLNELRKSRSDKGRKRGKYRGAF